MPELAKKNCAPCEDKTGKLSAPAAAHLAEELDKWTIVDEEAGSRIEKTLQFVDFAHALAFLNKVAIVAEAEGHHPDMRLFSWNKLTITLFTHSVGGLTENDFILAAKIDELVR